MSGKCCWSKWIRKWLRFSNDFDERWKIANWFQNLKSYQNAKPDLWHLATSAIFRPIRDDWKCFFIAQLKGRARGRKNITHHPRQSGTVILHKEWKLFKCRLRNVHTIYQDFHTEIIIMSICEIFCCLLSFSLNIILDNKTDDEKRNDRRWRKDTRWRKKIVIISIIPNGFWFSLISIDIWGIKKKKKKKQFQGCFLKNPLLLLIVGGKRSEGWKWAKSNVIFDSFGIHSWNVCLFARACMKIWIVDEYKNSENHISSPQ